MLQSTLHLQTSHFLRCEMSLSWNLTYTSRAVKYLEVRSCVCSLFSYANGFYENMLSYLRRWHSTNWMCSLKPTFWKEKRGRQGEHGILRVQPPWKNLNAPASVVEVCLPDSQRVARQFTCSNGHQKALCHTVFIGAAVLLTVFEQMQRPHNNESSKITGYKKRQEVHEEKV